MKKVISLLLIFTICITYAYADTVWVLCRQDSVVSEEWSITNKGFVKTKYLGVDYNVLLSVDVASATGNREPETLHYEND